MGSPRYFLGPCAMWTSLPTALQGGPEGDNGLPRTEPEQERLPIYPAALPAKLSRGESRQLPQVGMVGLHHPAGSPLEDNKGLWLELFASASWATGLPGWRLCPPCTALRPPFSSPSGMAPPLCLASQSCPAHIWYMVIPGSPLYSKVSLGVHSARQGMSTWPFSVLHL